jgi:GTP-sensing pleiotropic transcriptional regulator CodY
MNTLMKIANAIENRIETFHESPKPKGFSYRKAVEAENFADWIGASLALDAVLGPEHEDAKHVRTVIALLISTRGYSETKSLAETGRKIDAGEEKETVNV